MGSKPRATCNGTAHILVLETSSRLGSVALATNAKVVDTRQLTGQMRHAGELLPTIHEMLAAANWSAASLTDVYVSIGPGSFTGLRIAVTVARTLAWTQGLRIVAVPTLDAIARNALRADPAPENIAVILDAKRSQVYAGAFRRNHDGTLMRTADAQLTDPATFLARGTEPLAVLGEGIAYHRAAVDASGARVLDEALWIPDPRAVYQVGRAQAAEGEFTDRAELMPLYIRRPEAEEKWEKLHGPGGRKRT